MTQALNDLLFSGVFAILATAAEFYINGGFRREGH